jgi:hypothetical protein
VSEVDLRHCRERTVACDVDRWVGGGVGGHTTLTYRNFIQRVLNILC